MTNWRPASSMTSTEIMSEIAELGIRWDELRRDLEESGGMSGSPGEWMVERMDELEYERQRRAGLKVAVDGEVVAGGKE